MTGDKPQELALQERKPQDPAAMRRGDLRKPPWWSFRVWHGMTAGVWFRFLARHRYDIAPRFYLRAAGISLLSLLNAFAALNQRLLFGRRIAAEPVPPPVFIVGHWRSGTTFLHELLATDPRFITPTTFECFCPDHFLRWTRFITWFAFLLPGRRPMDDMAMGWSQPQEDEFALMAMGVRSPYEMVGFPNHRPEGMEWLHPDDLGSAETTYWQDALRRFLKAVTFQRRRLREKKGGQEPSWMLLKSPTHTARIGLLAAMFPGARFIHVVRDPQNLFDSARRLWPALYVTQGLQNPVLAAGPGRPPAMEALVNEVAAALYRDFDRDIAALPIGAFAEVRYEDLVRDPRSELARLYAAVGLGEHAEPAALDAYLADRADYRPNRHRLDPSTAAKVAREWGWYAERFGYPGPAPAEPLAAGGEPPAAIA